MPESTGSRLGFVGPATELAPYHQYPTSNMKSVP